MSCPKCGFPKQPGGVECPKCGIIYDKYEEHIKREPTEDVGKTGGEEKKEKAEPVKIVLKNLDIKKRISQLTKLQKTGLIVLVVLIAISIGFIIYTPDITIDGKISVITNEGQNIEPVMVEVNVFSVDSLLPHLLERKKYRDARHSVLLKKIRAAKNEYDKAFQELEYVFRFDYNKVDTALAARDAAEAKWLKLRDEEKEITSCDFYFRELPAPLTSTKTDSNGEFNIRIPGSGLHVITASAAHRVADDVEKYCWITEIDPDDGSRQTVTLSKKNLVSADDIENFINRHARELQ